MQLGTKEFYEVIDNFEKTIAKGRRLDKEDRSMWKKGCVYQSGEVNELFKSFQHGYAFCKCVNQV